MMRLVAHLDFERRFTKRVWIISSGDGMSEGKALELEKRIGGGEVSCPDLVSSDLDEVNPLPLSQFRILRIPRARRVHQSYLTSPFTTLHSLAFCLWHVAVAPLLSSSTSGKGRCFADLILLNGPGSCVPIACSAFLPRVRLLSCRQFSPRED
jgi:beta-1,4-N-acetylglucosaminyltransferase